MDKIISIFMKIFFDESKENNTAIIYNPKDLTAHYANEIKDNHLDGIYVATEYKNIVHTIELYKYKSHRQYADNYVDILAKIVDLYIPESDKDALVIANVPMHWSRYIIRGFDHIDYLCMWLSKKTGINYVRPLRAFFTKRQAKLTKSDRIQNRMNAFRIKKNITLPKSVIIIDDIISTGSTVNSCAKILKKSGVEKVYWVFIASNQ
jgi:ComF family protein